MTWRVAESLLELRDEVNLAAPNRSKRSDGTIGDPAHAARASDHNPNREGVVCAEDLTNDPPHGADMKKLAAFLAAHAHPALHYLIFNRQIASRSTQFRWRPYKGTNPHDKHMHVSVGGNYDVRSAWGAALAWRAPVLVQAGTRHIDVNFLQRLLYVPITGRVDNGTLRAIRGFQEKRHLVVDGIVGPKTWGALLR